MPWNTLEISDSESISKRDVKRAYAKKLKVTRPDRDPEGFQKLREAYESALNILSYREYDDEHSNDEGDTDNYTESEEDFLNMSESQVETQILEKINNAQPEISLIIDAIILDLKSDNITSAQSNLERSAEYIYTHPGAIDAWSQKMVYALNSSGILKLEFSDELLCYEIQSDNNHVAISCIEAWYQALNFTRLRQLSLYITNNPESIASPQAGFFCERLACMIAIYDVDSATKLSRLTANLMESQSYFGDLASEGRIYLGLIFKGLTDEDRIFWHRAVNEEVTDEEWNAPDINQTFKNLNAKANITIETLPIVRSFVPDQHLLNVRVLFKDNAPATTVSMSSSSGRDYTPGPYESGDHHQPHRSRRRRQQVTYEKSSGSNWPILIGVFVLIKICVFASKDCSSSSSSSSSGSGSYYDYDQIEDPIRITGEDIKLPERLQERLDKLRRENQHLDIPPYTPTEPVEPRSFDLESMPELHRP